MYHLIFREQITFDISIFASEPDESGIFRFGFFSHLFPKTHPFSTYMPKISVPPPVFSEKLEKDGQCRKMFKNLLSNFFRLLTSRYSEFRPLFTQNVSNIPNDALNHSCHNYNTQDSGASLKANGQMHAVYPPLRRMV